VYTIIIIYFLNVLYFKRQIINIFAGNTQEFMCWYNIFEAKQ